MSENGSDNGNALNGELPEGWASAPLGEIVTKLADGSHNPPKKQSSGVPMLSARNIVDGKVLFDDFRYISRPDFEQEDKRTSVRPDDVLLTIVGSIGRVAVVPRECEPFGLQRSVAVLKSDIFTPAFLARQLEAPPIQKELQEQASGTAQKGVYLRTLAKLPMAIPPVPEQHRIVAKVEELLASVNAATDKLAKVPLILKRFRQSVLAAACSGKLTEEWRETNTAETAADALQEAMERYRNAWKTKYGKVKGKKYEAPVGQGVERPDDLPPTWGWVRIGLLGADPLQPIQTGPFGALLHNSEFVDNGVPVIAVGNLTGLGFSTDGLYFITKQKAKELSRFDVNSGDLLFARSGATFGKVCVAPAVVEDWRMTGHILRVRLDERAILPDFAAFALRGLPEVVEQVWNNVRGATRPGYNTALLAGIHLPVPPLVEQREVIARVNGLFQTEDGISASAMNGTSCAERLTQSILAKAFRGELVPTEAEIARTEGRDYESAETLLENIRREMADKPKTTRRQRTQRRKRSPRAEK